MNATAYFENVLIDALCDLCEIAMIPLRLFSGLLWAIVAGAKLLWRCRRYIATAALVVGFCALCVAMPLLPLGLAITAVVGYVTWPRSAVQP